MGLKAILTRGKLQRAERELKRLHGLQKRVRRQLEELEEQRGKGKDAAAYEERKAKLDAHRHELGEKVKAAEAEAHRLQAEVKALDASA